MKRAVVPALALGLSLTIMSAPRAQVVEFTEAPRVEEILEILAPEVPVMRSDAPPTPRVLRNTVDGPAIGSSVPPAVAAQPPPAASRPEPSPAVAHRPAAIVRPHQQAHAARHAKGGLAQSGMFAPGTTELLPKGTTFLDLVSGALQRAPELRLLLLGHTDSSGDPRANDQLSRLRAEAAAHYLEEHGAGTGRLIPVGRGQRDPLPNIAPTDPANRRVEVWRVEDMPPG